MSVGSGAPLGSYGSGNLIGVWDQSNLRVYPWCSQEMLGGARPSEKQRVFLVLEWGLHAPFLCRDPVQGAKYKGIVVFPRCSQGLARINLVGVDFCSALGLHPVSSHVCVDHSRKHVYILLCIGWLLLFAIDVKIFPLHLHVKRSCVVAFDSCRSVA